MHKRAPRWRHWLRNTFTPPSFLAPDDDLVLAHLGQHVTARLGDQAFVREEQPAAPENPLQLELVYVAVPEDAAAVRAFARVDQIFGI